MVVQWEAPGLLISVKQSAMHWQQKKPTNSMNCSRCIAFTASTLMMRATSAREVSPWSACPSGGWRGYCCVVGEVNSTSSASTALSTSSAVNGRDALIEAATSTSLMDTVRFSRSWSPRLALRTSHKVCELHTWATYSRPIPSTSTCPGPVALQMMHGEMTLGFGHVCHGGESCMVGIAFL